MWTKTYNSCSTARKTKWSAVLFVEFSVQFREEISVNSMNNLQENIKSGKQTLGQAQFEENEINVNSLNNLQVNKWSAGHQF